MRDDELVAGLCFVAILWGPALAIVAGVALRLSCARALLGCGVLTLAVCAAVQGGGLPMTMALWAGLSCLVAGAGLVLARLFTVRRPGSCD